MPTIPFGATNTAAEVVAGLDLAGRRAIVTGGGSGIGAEAARILEAAGADVTIADCQVAPPHVAGVRRRVAAYAKDPEKAARLWDLSLDLLNHPVRQG